MEFDSEPDSENDSGSVADFDSASDSDSATDEYFMPAILRLVVGSSRRYDQLQYSMYMNTTSVENIFGNVQ